jgi:hypothetical protein
MIVDTDDGRNFILMEDFLFGWRGREFKVPKGSRTDGASTPRFTWDLLPPFGIYWKWCVCHDSAYQGTLMVIDDVSGVWVTAMLSKEESDEMLSDLMEAGKVVALDADAIYEGVKWGGWKAFREDRANG